MFTTFTLHRVIYILWKMIPIIGFLFISNLNHKFDPKAFMDPFAANNVIAPISVKTC